MTALNPVELGVRVKGVPSVRYPINEVCSHPKCNKPIESRHHIFNRNMIGGGSWFVEVPYPGSKYDVFTHGSKVAIPHVTGLCGTGTTGHHGEVEEHRAWIKYEDEEFVWYDRIAVDGYEETSGIDANFQRVGPLNPQPCQGLRKVGTGSRGPRKPKARDRKTISLGIPKEEQEDGGGLWDDLVDQLKKMYDAKDHGDYAIIMRAMYERLTSG